VSPGLRAAGQRRARVGPLQRRGPGAGVRLRVLHRPRSAPSGLAGDHPVPHDLSTATGPRRRHQEVGSGCRFATPLSLLVIAFLAFLTVILGMDPDTASPCTPFRCGPAASSAATCWPNPAWPARPRPNADYSRPRLRPGCEGQVRSMCCMEPDAADRGQSSTTWTSITVFFQWTSGVRDCDRPGAWQSAAVCRAECVASQAISGTRRWARASSNSHTCSTSAPVSRLPADRTASARSRLRCMAWRLS